MVALSHCNTLVIYVVYEESLSRIVASGNHFEDLEIRPGVRPEAECK